MVIRTKKEWQQVLDAGAKVISETRLHKIFQMPNGEIWRVLPMWRRAWRVYINDAGDLGSAEAHNLS